MTNEHIVKQMYATEFLKQSYMERFFFQALDGKAFELFRKFVSGMELESCERSWANLQLYVHTYSWQYMLENDRLWIASPKQKYVFFPLGNLDLPPEEFLPMMKKFAGYCGGAVTCGDIPEDYLLKYPEAAGYLESDPGDIDYIYDLRQIRDFQGARLRKRHNHVRQFDREYENDHSVEVVEKETLPEVLKLAEKLSFQHWQSESGREEQAAFRKLPELWDDPACSLGGILLKIGGQPAGFSIYSALTPELADIHFEKADREFTGCGAKLTNLLAEHLISAGFREMNREQDLNIEGLRRAKQALDPCRFYRRLSLQFE